MLKEAILLAQNGYKVTVINTGYSAQLSNEDDELIKPYNIKLLSAVTLQAGSMKSILLRLIGKTGRWMVRVLKMETPLALGYYSWGYKNLALKQDADLYICHQEIGLYCGVQLIEQQKKVAFDLEDWYSEDLLPEAKSYRPLILLRQLEQQALQKGVFCISTSNVMAKHLGDAYHSSEPTRIYNVFNKDRSIFDEDKQMGSPLRLFWFSQTIGPGRGLEEFVALLHQMEAPLELHLLGNVSVEYRSLLQSGIAQKHKIFFHEPVKAALLPEKIKSFDIGLAIENTSPLSRNYTVTNKFFQYLQAGLPVIATRTAGQIEAFEKYKPGILINLPAGAKDIGDLNTWLSDKQALKNATRAAQNAAREYNWENESKKLLSLVEKALHE